MSVTFNAAKEAGGRWIFEYDHPALLNLAEGNAQALLSLLRLEGYTSVALPEARRAIMVARATFDRRTIALTREARTEGRHFQGGLDWATLAEYLERFARFVETAAAYEARVITWG